MLLIHQIILGKRVPPLNQECLHSWHLLKERGFDILEWTDQGASEYVAKCQPQVQRLYARARNYAEASDILRMAITYGLGGLYVDWDVLLVDPDRFISITSDVATCDCLLIEDCLTTETGFASVYDNSLFYLKNRNPLALDFLAEMDRGYSSDPVPNTAYLTGPLALTRFLNDHPCHLSACRTIDMLDMYAFDYERVVGETGEHGRREQLRDRWAEGGPPAIHFWTHTWFPKPRWPRRVLDKAVRTLGLRTRPQ